VVLGLATLPLLLVACYDRAERPYRPPGIADSAVPHEGRTL